MKSYTFSSTHRLLGCGWEYRDDAEYPPEKPSSADANFGTAVHAGGFAEREPDLDAVCQKLGVLPGEVVPSVRSLREHIESLHHTDVRYEAAYAWHPQKDDVIHLGNHLERDYSDAPEGYYCGTSDYEGIDGETLVIADGKTGHANNVEPIASNGQLLMLAFCSATARGWTGPIRIELWFVRPGRVWVEAADVTLFELWDMAQRVRERMRMLPVLPATTGDHCRYCPAAGACPATKEQMGAIIEAGAEGWSTAIQSPQHAAWMAERLPALKKAIELVKGELEKYADEVGGIPLSNGKVWKSITGKRDSLNVAAVKARLGDELPQYMTTTEFKQYRAVKK